jgi:pimeloyl-ACP methyl ester carboxylesterase
LVNLGFPHTPRGSRKVFGPDHAPTFLLAPDLTEALAKLTVPTLVVLGELDRLTPPGHSRRMVAALPHVSEFVLLRETGHMVPLERPDELLEALVGLAESVGLSVT